jgi:uncharacterized protein (DUF488 family)
MSKFRGLTETSERSWPTVWTIGHSTRAAEDFIQILKAHHIEMLVDVRSFPASRRFPHFNSAQLAESLSEHNITYRHVPALGGRRRPTAASRNTAWRNSSFRAYADHMETAEFKQGIDDLRKLASENKTAIMCAEALWWRCHRSLIADHLKALGATVIHISDEKQAVEHPFTSAARIVRGQLSYEGLFAEQQGDETPL